MKREHKPIRYVEHARKRMQQRGVSVEQVFETVRKPDSRGSARREGAERLVKKFSRKVRIVVIAEEEPTFIRIVTAHRG